MRTLSICVAARPAVLAAISPLNKPVEDVPLFADTWFTIFGARRE